MPAVGTSVARKEGADKVTGRTQYTDDLAVPGVLHGRTIRSTVARGRLRGITWDPAFDWTGIVRVTAADIPGENIVALIEDDQPALVADEIRHCAEPVALVAAEDKERAEEAARHVTLDVEPLPAVLDPRDPGAEVLKTIHLELGEVDAAFARADAVIVEGEYRTGYQEQLYIEPQVIIALPRADGGIEIRGSMQCPYYIHGAMQRLLKLGGDRVVIVQCATGGGFGGKEDYPSMIASHAALLARKAGRPVKILYSRQEDIAATTKRHPTVIRHRTAVTRDGKLLACDVDILVDAGAYVTLTPVVLSRAALHGHGAYRWPAARLHARSVRTHTPPNGAFRGFGAPQAFFAIEAQMEKVAAAIGMAPHELRRKNALVLGDDLPSGGKLRFSVAAHEVLEEALRATRFEERRAEITAENAAARTGPRGAGPRRVRGVGLSLFKHGAGFTGNGEVKLQSVAGVEVTPEGRLCVLAASTEIGQGTRTIFAQMAADAFGCAYDDVEVADPDTSRVPNSGPTVASRTAMVVGGLVAKAAAALKARRPAGMTLAAWAASAKEPLREYAKYEAPPGIVFDEKTYRGDGYGAYGWGANVAEVEVDLDTGETTVLKLFCAIDPGTVIHPVLAEGQVEGGSAQGLGWATLEEMKTSGGRYLNDRMSTYIIPTSLDTPPITVKFVETPYEYGGLGAKGIGELPLDGPAPAVAAAIFHATGHLPHEIPATPERVLEALGETR